MRLIVTIPGIGNNHFEEKKVFLKKNIDIIKKTFSGDIDFLLFNYSNNDFSDFESSIKIIKESGIIGQFIFNKLKPDSLEEYDYIILMLDDIELSDNFNIDEMIKIYDYNKLDILSPSLTKDSKFSHNGFMLEDEKFEGCLRIVNFCEYFFYLMNIKSYQKYYKLFDKKTYWLWGIDLCLDKQGFKMGILNNFKIKHYYISESYNSTLPNPHIEMYDKINKYGKISESKNLILKKWQMEYIK
jgi:hypothetical protein